MPEDLRSMPFSVRRRSCITCQRNEAEGVVATNGSSLAGMLRGRRLLAKDCYANYYDYFAMKYGYRTQSKSSICWHRVHRTAKSRYTELVSLGTLHDWSLLRILTTNTPFTLKIPDINATGSVDHRQLPIRTITTCRIRTNSS